MKGPAREDRGGGLVEHGAGAIAALEAHRAALLAEARRLLGRGLGAKEGASDVVQEAMVVAVRRVERFAGESSGELLAWLRAILRHRAAHAVRRYRGTKKRAIGRERSIEAGGAGVAICDGGPSPGAIMAGEERARALGSAVEALGEADRRVVGWRHQEGCTFEEIGRRLGISDVAARKRWARAVGRLRAELARRGVEA